MGLKNVQLKPINWTKSYWKKKNALVPRLEPPPPPPPKKKSPAAKKIPKNHFFSLQAAKKLAAKKLAQQKTIAPTVKNVARPKSRVTLHATSLAATVAQNVFLTQMLRARNSVKVISGVLVRLTTCKRLTNSLPKLSLITLSPPETPG